jgi:hypothetical protein
MLEQQQLFRLYPRSGRIAEVRPNAGGGYTVEFVGGHRDSFDGGVVRRHGPAPALEAEFPEIT